MWLFDLIAASALDLRADSFADNGQAEHPIGSRVLAAQASEQRGDYESLRGEYFDETLCAFVAEREKQHTSLTATDTGYLWGIPTGQPHPLMICLLAFCIVCAATLMVRETSRTADQQQAAGQLVGYDHTDLDYFAPPPSPPTVPPSPPSSAYPGPMAGYSMPTQTTTASVKESRP